MDDQNATTAVDTDGIAQFHFEGEISKDTQRLIDMVQQTEMPDELLEKVSRMLESLIRQQGTPAYNAAYDSVNRYLEWAVKIPWYNKSQDNLDLDKARDILETTHFGLDSIKERILEYLAIVNLQTRSEHDEVGIKAREEVTKEGGVANPVLFFVGLPGIGKTSISYTIAKALNREFARIPMGGMGDALQLRGQSRLHDEAEPGQVIKALVQAGTRNPVILLDEVDRTAEQARAQIMGVLLELLDPQQNFAYRDNYIDFPFDLSNVLFLASANNTGGISNAVLDRMEVIKMPGYSDDEKIIIARDYILPKQLKVTGMPENTIEFDEEVWPKIARPLGFDAGIRTMERTVNAIVRKVAKRMVLGEGKSFHITLENLKDFLPKY